MANQQRQKKSTNQGSPKSNLTKDFNAYWITDGIDDAGLEWVEEVGNQLRKQELTTSQIRGIFGELRRIQMKGIGEKENQIKLRLLKPKLAYAQGRARGKAQYGIELFKNVYDKAYDAIQFNSGPKELKQQYDNLVHLMESIVAYHRYHGGKE
jgi:CRISPR-associated protein Csm2